MSVAQRLMLGPRRPLVSAVSAARSTLSPQPQSFHVSAVQNAFGETDIHKDHGDRKAEIDAHKHDALHKQKSGQAEWKPELASSSEAALKADRDDLDASEESIREMQKQTEDLVKKGN